MKYGRYCDNRLDAQTVNVLLLSYCAYMKNHCYEIKTGKILELKLRQITTAAGSLDNRPVLYILCYTIKLSAEITASS